MAKRKDRTKKRLEKRALKRAVVPNPHLRDRVKLPEGLNGFSDRDHMFWLAHGINYLVSDYENGVWDPLFEDLYKGKLPTVEQITRAVLNRFPSKDESKAASPEANPVLAWTVQDKAVVYIISREAERAVKSVIPKCHAKVTARLPKQPAVWEVFVGLKRKVLSAA